MRGKSRPLTVTHNVEIRARSFSVNTSDATSSTNLPGFRVAVDEATGEKSGIVDFTVEIQEAEGGWAFGSGVSVAECAFPYTRR